MRGAAAPTDGGGGDQLRGLGVDITYVGAPRYTYHQIRHRYYTCTLSS
jgi:hypothetical protein